MTKLVCISDTHNNHSRIQIEECDILIHAGDATLHGSEMEVSSFLNWFSSLDQAKHKVFIPGNHDFFFTGKTLTNKYTNKEIKDYIPSNVHYLVDKSVTLEGLKVYGTPWTPFFFDWAFNGLEHDPGKDNAYHGGPGPSAEPDTNHPLLRKIYSAIEDDTEVLVCHGPPRLSPLDHCLEGNRVGSTRLLERIKQLPKLKAGIFGHIHEAYGSTKLGNVDLYNVCSLKRDYKTLQPPVVINL